MNAPRPAAARGSLDAASTFELVHLANGGNAEAVEVLFSRYLGPLQRWASGRLPRWARSTSDTNDIVQETLINAIRKLGTFEPRREGALLAYLRQAVMNRVRDELRRASVRPARVELDDAYQAGGPSPLDEVIGLDTMARYEAALARLRAEDREAIVARIEFGQSYDELAVTLDKPTREAARMAVSRALVRLATEMKRIPEKDG